MRLKFMTDHAPSSKRSAIGLRARATRRAKRLLGPTLGVFGLDSDGHLVPAAADAGKEVEARVREADEKDDHARLAITEAEIATERSEKQQGASRRARLNG
jgi:hypothetical protein